MAANDTDRRPPLQSLVFLYREIFPGAVSSYPKAPCQKKKEKKGRKEGRKNKNIVFR